MHSNLPRSISRISFRGCPEEMQTALRSRIPIREGTVLTGELLQQAVQEAKALDERLEIQVAARVYGVNVTIYDPAVLPRRIIVEASVRDSMLVEKVTPAHVVRTDVPAIDVVRPALIVGKDGTVVDAQGQTGPPASIDSARQAVMQWKYRPLPLNGFPVEVQTVVEVSVATQ